MWAGWVHHSWRFGHVETFCEVGPEMPKRGWKMSMVPVVWETFGIFFGSVWSKWFPVTIGDHGWNLVISLWPRDETKQQSMEWQHSSSSRPAPKNSESKNSLEKFSPRFFGIKMASSSLIIFQRAILSMWSITHLCWCNWRTFWRKNAKAAGRSQMGVFFLHDNAPAHQPLAT